MPTNETEQDASGAGACRLDRPVGRPAPTRYYLRYLCDSYTLADAFRPQPGWGAKGYTVEADKLGEHTDEDVIRSAQEKAPPGYWLQHIEAIGGEPWRRDVFKKAVPLSKTPNAKLSGLGRTEER